MMALPSSLLAVINFIEDEPMMMVFFAAFGVFFGGIAIALVIGLITRLLRVRFPSRWGYWLASYFVLVWLIGFVSQILLGFAGLSGLHLMAIWLAMALVILLFCISHAHLLVNFFSEIEDKTQ